MNRNQTQPTTQHPQFVTLSQSQLTQVTGGGVIESLGTKYTMFLPSQSTARNTAQTEEIEMVIERLERG